MNFTSRPCSIRVAMPPWGERVPTVDFIDDEAPPPPARRAARPLVGYAGPEGAAWFEAVMADFDPSLPLQRAAGPGTC